MADDDDRQKDPRTVLWNFRVAEGLARRKALLDADEMQKLGRSFSDDALMEEIQTLDRDGTPLAVTRDDLQALAIRHQISLLCHVAAKGDVRGCQLVVMQEWWRVRPTDWPLATMGRLACAENREEMFGHLMLKRWRPDGTDLFAAARNGSFECLSMLLDMVVFTPDDWKTALRGAALAGRANCVLRLLKGGPRDAVTPEMLETVRELMGEAKYRHNPSGQAADESRLPDWATTLTFLQATR